MSQLINVTDDGLTMSLRDETVELLTTAMRQYLAGRPRIITNTRQAAHWERAELMYKQLHVLAYPEAPVRDVLPRSEAFRVDL